MLASWPFHRPEHLELGRPCFVDYGKTGPTLDDVAFAAAQTLLHHSTLAIGEASNRHSAAAGLRQRRHRETFSAWIA